MKNILIISIICCYGHIIAQSIVNGYKYDGYSEYNDGVIGYGSYLTGGDYVFPDYRTSFIAGENIIRSTINCINEEGDVKWSMRLTKMIGTNWSCPTKDNGIILTTYNSTNEIEESKYSYIYKMGSDGQLKWSKGLDITISYSFSLQDGSFIVLGNLKNTLTENNLLLKFTEEGTLLWVYSFDKLSIDYIEELDKEALVIIGNFKDQLGNSFLGLVWLDNEGKKTDGKKVFLGKDGYMLPHKIIRTDDRGLIIAGGLEKNEANDKTYGFLLKLNKNHSKAWMKIVDGPFNDIELFDLCRYKDSWIAVGLLVSSEFTWVSSLIMSFTDEGKVNWSGRIADSLITSVRYCYTNHKGQLIYTGDSYLSNYKPAENARVSIIFHPDPDGHLGCKEQPVPMTVSDFTAYTYTDVDIMQDTVTTLKFLDLKVGIEPDDYITGYTICETTATTEVSAEAGALRLYPNPVSTTLSIDVEQAGYGTVREQTVDITDLLGRKLYEVEVGYDGHAEVDTQTLPPGMYIAVLRADMHQVQAVKFVVGR